MAETKKQEVAVAEEKTEVATHNNKVTDYSLGIFGTSDNFIMAMQMAKALASSTIVPQTFQKNDANCLIAIEQAQRLRVSPLMVMQNLYVIQGRPSWSSKFLIAAINNSGNSPWNYSLRKPKIRMASLIRVLLGLRKMVVELRV